MFHHYEQEGFLDAHHFTLPGHRINVPILQNMYIYDRANYKQKVLDEKLPLNVCLYKYMYKFKYLAILVTKASTYFPESSEIFKDFDEILVPQANISSWTDMMYEIAKKPKKIYKSFAKNVLFNYAFGIQNAELSSDPFLDVSSWRFKNYFFKPPDKINNETLPMMDATLRDPASRGNGKSFVNTELVKESRHKDIDSDYDCNFLSVCLQSWNFVFFEGIFQYCFG